MSEHDQFDIPEGIEWDMYEPPPYRPVVMGRPDPPLWLDVVALVGVLGVLAVLALWATPVFIGLLAFGGMGLAISIASN